MASSVAASVDPVTNHTSTTAPVFVAFAGTDQFSRYTVASTNPK